MNLTIFLSLVASACFAANLNSFMSYTAKTVISPFTGKTYVLYDSSSSTTHTEAADVCASYEKNSKLAVLQPESGDIEFLGGFIEVDQPYWIGELTGALSTICSAIYANGAIAIPKKSSTSSSSSSPCHNHLNVLCELTMES